MVTGESRPVAHAVGDEVAAGTRLLAADGNGRGDGGMVLVRAVRVGAKSTLGSIMELVERVYSIACFTSTKVRMLTQKALLGVCVCGGVRATCRVFTVNTLQKYEN